MTSLDNTREHYRSRAVFENKEEERKKYFFI